MTTDMYIHVSDNDILYKYFEATSNYSTVIFSLTFCNEISFFFILKKPSKLSFNKIITLHILMQLAAADRLIMTSLSLPIIIILKFSHLSFGVKFSHFFIPRKPSKQSFNNPANFDANNLRQIG